MIDVFLISRRDSTMIQRIMGISVIPFLSQVFRLASFLFILVLLTQSLPSSAQTDTPSFNTTVSADSSTSDARLAFRKGESAFKLNRFAQALDYYSLAYDKSGYSEILFNIGQCHRNLRNYAAAADAFRSYLAANPDSDKRPAVETLLSDLDDYQPAPPDPASSAPATPSPEVVHIDKTDHEPEEKINKNMDLDSVSNKKIVQSSETPVPNEATATKTPFYKTWWFWTTIGVVAAGSAAGGIYLYSQQTGSSNYDHIWSIP